MKSVLLCALVFVFAVASLSAQMSCGRITGRVTDSSGAVLPQASVQSVHLATNVVASTKTNAGGDSR